MSDEMAVCEFCGDEYKAQGLAAHQRYCDETPADEEKTESTETSMSSASKQSPSDSVATAGGSEDGSLSETTSSELESATFDRDDCTCLVCGDDNGLRAHTVDPDGPDELANRLTLCPECDESLAGLHPLTKRTKAFH